MLPAHLRAPAGTLRTYLLAALAPLVALAAAWAPELRHWHVARVSLSADTAAQALQSLELPACRELAGYDLLGLAFPPQELAERAEKLRRGELVLESGRIARIHPQFDPEDLEVDAGMAPLQIASLVVPDIWIRASTASGDTQSLQLAREYVNDWLRFERRSLLPRALQWNDHAVSERVFVLTRYLLASGQLSENTAAEKAAAVEYILESGERLTKPGYYTYRTNHGLMQNIALVHIGACLSGLPRAKQLAALGADRIRQQLQVYIADEGIVLEHSAGYHRLGIELLSIALREMELTGFTVDESMRQRLARAIDAYAVLRRPDGTLPSWGDTRASELPPLAPRSSAPVESIGPLELWQPQAAPGGEDALFAPVSGLSAHWSGMPGIREFQTLVTWSDFATRAHKHRDEMSLLVWARGADLLVGSGYWPHDFPHGEQAVNWGGSNAPHLQGEPAGSASSTRLLGYARNSEMEFLDLEREIGPQQRLRRQILHVGSNRWAVLDSQSPGLTGRTEVSWTFGPTTSITADADLRTLRISSPPGADTFAFRTQGCEGGELRMLRESAQPFGGWTAMSGSVVATKTLLRRCPGAQWTLSTLTPADESLDVGASLSPEQWQLQTASNAPLFSRSGNTLVVNGRTIELQSGESFEPAKARIDQAFFAMARRYARFKESLLPYRVKVSKAVGALWLVQMVVLYPMLRYAFRRSRNLGIGLGVLTVSCWLALAAWLHFVYFIE